jgi:hypothetical protein
LPNNAWDEEEEEEEEKEAVNGMQGLECGYGVLGG